MKLLSVNNFPLELRTKKSTTEATRKLRFVNFVILFIPYKSYLPSIVFSVLRKYMFVLHSLSLPFNFFYYFPFHKGKDQLTLLIKDSEPPFPPRSLPTLLTLLLEEFFLVSVKEQKRMKIRL